MPRYLIDPSVCFLNHGSFGATPEELLKVQDQLRHEMEREPIDFLIRKLPERLKQARDDVAEFIGSDPEGTVFVQNATAGVNAVLGSLKLSPGDEILTTNHRYDAVRFTLDRAAQSMGATVVEAQIPFPINSPSQVLESVEAAITDSTALMIIDQITSPTALIFPAAELVDLARSRGIPILIDGAHAPGQVELNLTEMRPDFWVGNLHKWLCAPKGAAVLVVDEAWQDRIHPTVTSHGYTQGIEMEFHWCGTFDPSPWLTAPAAIRLHQDQGGPNFQAAHHSLVQSGREVIAEAISVELPHPDDASLYGAMATIPLPISADGTHELFRALREEEQIEVPIIPWRGQGWVRISGFAGYNTPEQYVRLAQALKRQLRA